MLKHCNSVILLYIIIINIISAEKCLEENVTQDTTQSELFAYLTDRCRYNRYIKPPTADNEPIHISTKIYVYHLKTTSTNDLDIDVQMLLELKWEDPRLMYSHLDTNISFLIGEKFLFNSIWIPHLFTTSEKKSLVLGPMRKDDLVNVLPSGTVFFTARLRSSLVCKLYVGKFPFDKQTCDLVMDSWRYNSSALQLVWDKNNPIQMSEGGRVSLAEFYLISMEDKSTFDIYETAGRSYNYSSIILRFQLGREYGFYIMDYYIPSCFLVILSWFSFWQKSNDLPSRVNIGTQTMLTFIMLGWLGDSLPRTAQFMANDVWELSVTAFLFLSLAEFAFVNTIDRSGESSVKLKRPTTKYILRSSLSLTPKEPKSINRRRVSSVPSSPEIRKHFSQFLSPDYQPNFTKNKFGIEQGTLKKPTTIARADSPIEINNLYYNQRIFTDELNKALKKVKQDERNAATLVFMMTPQEIAQWIDEKSRFLFPASFLIFNIVYWTFTVLA